MHFPEEVSFNYSNMFKYGFDGVLSSICVGAHTAFRIHNWR